jgi:hypothetical protein
MITILWGCVIAVVIALILIIVAEGMKFVLSRSDYGLDGHRHPPLVPTPPDSPGLQVEVLSKFTIGKHDSKKGEQVLYLDGINGNGFTS